MSIRIADEVATARAENRPVVALESTVFSRLGLPSPANERALDRCLAAVRAGGAVPAVTAVIDGEARVGLSETEHDRILGADTKTAARDLPIAVAAGWPVGVTTVSAALALAASAGVEVFATGGIGGVHHRVAGDAPLDVSADLGALARFRVVCVSAGAKAFLDLEYTVEHLESLGVPVLGWATDYFPAFYLPSSGVPVHHRVEDAEAVAQIFRAGPGVSHHGGVLVGVPIPAAAALDADEVLAAVAVATTEAATRGISGGATTPFILEHMTAVTEGRSIPANLALAEHNAAVAAAIATALAG